MKELYEYEPVICDYEKKQFQLLAKSCVADTIAGRLETCRKVAVGHLDNIQRMQEERGDALIQDSFEYSQEVRWYWENQYEAEIWAKMLEQL